MKDPLREIFDHFQELCTPTEEHWEQYRIEEEILDRLRLAAGEELVDDLVRCSAGISWQNEYEWFREGFRLGVALMREAGSFPA